MSPNSYNESFSIYLYQYIDSYYGYSIPTSPCSCGSAPIPAPSRSHWSVRDLGLVSQRAQPGWPWPPRPGLGQRPSTLPSCLRSLAPEIPDSRCSSEGRPRLVKKQHGSISQWDVSATRHSGPGPLGPAAPESRTKPPTGHFRCPRCRLSPGLRFLGVILTSVPFLSSSERGEQGELGGGVRGRRLTGGRAACHSLGLSGQGVRSGPPGGQSGRLCSASGGRPGDQPPVPAQGSGRRLRFSRKGPHEVTQTQSPAPVCVENEPSAEEAHEAAGISLLLIS